MRGEVKVFEAIVYGLLSILLTLWFISLYRVYGGDYFWIDRHVSLATNNNNYSSNIKQSIPEYVTDTTKPHCKKNEFLYKDLIMGWACGQVITATDLKIDDKFHLKYDSRYPYVTITNSCKDQPMLTVLKPPVLHKGKIPYTTMDITIPSNCSLAKFKHKYQIVCTCN